MKHIILSAVITLTAMGAMAQMNTMPLSANYEAANWKTWLLDNPQQIMTVYPVNSKRSLVHFVILFSLPT